MLSAGLAVVLCRRLSWGLRIEEKRGKRLGDYRARGFIQFLHYLLISLLLFLLFVPEVAVDMGVAWVDGLRIMKESAYSWALRFVSKLYLTCII